MATYFEEVGQGFCQLANYASCFILFRVEGIDMKQVALAIIINSEGEYLMQHKDKYAPNNPNTWCLFGGGIEGHESPEDTVIREIYEELLEYVSDTRLVSHNINENERIERYYFVINWELPIKKLKTQLREGDDVGYFNVSELKDLKINQAHLEAILQFDKTKR